MRPIVDVARELGLLPDEIETYGPWAAKVRLDVLSRLADRPNGKHVLVTAVTPTPLGEGKTTTSIGLAQAFCRLGVKCVAALRQPSLGPVFGVKGGGSGGGKSQLLPIDLINLGLTGDLHAITAAHNLASAFIDNHLHHGNKLGIDPHSISWPRVVDTNDRALRHAVVGLGGDENGVPREEQWQITAASEVMAILALATDLRDLRHRLGRIIIGAKHDGTPVTLEDLKVAGAMAAIMRESIKPNLVQTMEGGPAFLHAGPFANIAHGNSSVIGDRIALKLADVVLTEGGFGADMGAEKFFDIKCRQGELRPDVVVLVATIRALKMHGGVGKVAIGKALDPALTTENVPAVQRGAENLAKHVENMVQFGVPCVVAINGFPQDTPAEIAAVREVALRAGAQACVPATHFANGGAGAEDVARAVRAAWTSSASRFAPLYSDEMPLAAKIETIATRIYGADGVDFSAEAKKQLAEFEKRGYGKLPVCMAKTQLSLSHDPALRGRPRGFRVPVREARLLAGAGFVTAVLGEMRLMPGLGSVPAGEHIDIDADGNVVGLE